MSSLRRCCASWLFLLALLPAACGGDDDDLPGVVRTVLVVDEGFDPAAPVFAGKLEAQYTRTCDTPPAPTPADAGAVDGAAPTGDAGAPADADPLIAFEREKAEALAGLAIADESCGLAEGIASKPDPFPEAAPLRQRWNGMIRGGRFASQVFSKAEYDRVAAAFDRGFMTTRYHGTATAGLIALENPSVRLVLVEQQLGSFAEVMRTFTCLKQADLDQAVRLWTDPQVKAAYANRPLSRWERDLDAVVARHGVQLINESFGPLSRVALERLQAMKGCPPVNLRPYYAMYAQLYQAREAARPGPAVLLVRSAGNDASLDNGPEDNSACYTRSQMALTIGSYGPTGARSPFSNRGSCVDAYAPGESVIAPLPGGWWLNLNGTSFAAPLVVRLLSRLPDTMPSGPAEAQARLLALRDPSQHIPLGLFPKNVFYAPELRKGGFGQPLTVDEASPDTIDVRGLDQTLQFLDLVRKRER